MDAVVQVGDTGISTSALIALAVSALIILWPLSRIAHRAGYSGWWALLALVPAVNILLLLVFAFVRWPVERELGQWRTQAQRLEQAHLATAKTSFLGY